MDVGKSQPRRARGLTLVELIGTLAVAGVCLAVVVPAWSGMINRSYITTAANQLLTQLRYARNEAVTRNQAITLCPSLDGRSCTGDPQGWPDGFIVFVDADRNRDRSPDESLLANESSDPRP